MVVQDTTAHVADLSCEHLSTDMRPRSNIVWRVAYIVDIDLMAAIVMRYRLSYVIGEATCAIARDSSSPRSMHAAELDSRW
nr:hypothetical protein CFP56_69057 [Quercus suber]